MTAITVATKPLSGQKAGTSGLRRKTRDYMVPQFLENYVQSIFNALGGVSGKRFVLGGDGRYFNEQALQTLIRMAAANGASEVIIGQNGLLSTPAASHLIRLNGVDGGFILSASHNPAGIDEDFGLKYNASNGGPATETLTDEIYKQTQIIESYSTLETPDIDLGVIGTQQLGQMKINVVDPVADYIALMDELFDFDAIRAMFAGGFRMVFDAMHAITGPYATALFEGKFGAPAGTVIHGTPLVDFGGGHPDPNPVWAHKLMAIMHGPDAPDFGAASDGDGDRNMIVGPNLFVTPSDSLALIAAQADCAPAYKNGLAGVARSMPTSTAVDRVAAAKGISCYETPTGWKFFGNLLDHGKITLCGEESAGTGSDHVREKDGLWAVLMWLNIIAKTGKSVPDLMASHWETYGRNYYTRHDYEAIDTTKANALMDHLRSQLPTLVGKSFAGLDVTAADEFSYHDPVDNSTTSSQGIRIMFAGDARAVFRLSGTGTQGATLRMYLEQLDTENFDKSPADVLTSVVKAAVEIADVAALTGREKPDVVT